MRLLGIEGVKSRQVTSWQLPAASWRAVLPETSPNQNIDKKITTVISAYSFTIG